MSDLLGARCIVLAAFLAVGMLLDCIGPREEKWQATLVFAGCGLLFVSFV